jgi:O-antigen/teichoic acid export membrane protein
MVTRLARAQFDATRLRSLLRDGGWITVSNLVSPLMNTLDRYILGFARQAAVVAFYAAPSDAANKLLVVPVAITRGLFPALSREASAASRQALVRQAHRLVALYCVPLAVAGAWLSPLVLDLWLGPAFVAPSTPVLRILMVGFLLGAFAQVPFTEVQARGRADVSARLHLLELGPFLVGAWWLSREHGAIGAALAWTLRYAVDLVLHGMAARSIRQDDLR